MAITETLRIPAHAAARAFVESGLLPNHDMRGYAEQFADGHGVIGHLCGRAFSLGDGDAIPDSIAGALDFSPTTNVLYANPGALAFAIARLSHIADAARAEAATHQEAVRAAKGDEQAQLSALASYHAAGARESAANVLAMLATGCRILAIGREATAPILGMLERRERDAQARLQEMRDKVAKGSARDDGELSEMTLSGLSEAWFEAKSASAAARKIAQGEGL